MSNARRAWRFVLSHDWPTTFHKAGVYMRALRGDVEEATQDDARMRDAAERTRGGLEEIARQVVGCRRTAECQCGVCREKRGEN